MRNFFSSKWLLAILLILVFCLGTIIYTSVSGNSSPLTSVLGAVAAPIQKSITWVSDRFADGYNFVFRYRRTMEENEQLRAQVRELEQQVRDLEYAKEENDSLRALLEIKERNRSFTLEIAEVIAQNTGNWAYTLSIDKGSLAGVEVNDCVITEEGMVGYVSQVGPNYAEITTVLDPTLQVGSIVTRTREVAVAKGDFVLMEDGRLKLSYLKKDADAVIGDTVEISGTGGVFPKGLMLGTIERILPEEHGISNYAILKPAVDIPSVKKVYVITDFAVTD